MGLCLLLTNFNSLNTKLADFAKSIRGDFDKLAECISEDLIEAIEKLNETFEGYE